MLKYKKNIILCLCICLGILTAISFCIKFVVVPYSSYEKFTDGSNNVLVLIMAQLRYMINATELKYSIIALFYAIAYFQYYTKKYVFSKSNYLFSAILTLLTIIGKCFADAGNMAFLYTSYKYIFFVLFLE